ncbi:MAG: general secretion pathway protein L [Paraglaciecola sp.]|jgi:general secretion pathway protein L
MEQLVVRLGSDTSDPIHWIVWSNQQNEIIASGELPNSQELASLAERAGQRPITVLVPSSDTLLKWVSLPAKAGRKAITAIPYILEDEISSDIAQQFFALGPSNGNEQAVAIVAKKKLQKWLEIISHAGLNCEKIIPDVLALPVANKGWSILELGTQVLIRQDQWAGLLGEKEWLIQAINHHAKQQTDPLSIDNYSDTELLGLTHVEIKEQALEMPMKVLAKGALNARFNLLQGEFKPKNQSRNDWKKWRLAASLAVFVFLTSLVDKVFEQQELSSQRTELRAQINAEFKRAFPGAAQARDVKTVMQTKIAALEKSGGGSSVLTMLTQLIPAFAESQVKPQTIKFDGARTELRMQAVASNFESLEQFKKLAEAQGFEVQQGAINNKDSQVIGTLTIGS